MAKRRGSKEQRDAERDPLTTVLADTDLHWFDAVEVCAQYGLPGVVNQRGTKWRDAQAGRRRHSPVGAATAARWSSATMELFRLLRAPSLQRDARVRRSVRAVAAQAYMLGRLAEQLAALKDRGATKQRPRPTAGPTRDQLKAAVGKIMHAQDVDHTAAVAILSDDWARHFPDFPNIAHSARTLHTRLNAR